MMHSKRFTGSLIFSVLTLFNCFSLISCGVKQKDSTSLVNSNQNQAAGNLPDGVIASKNRKFLFSPSTDKLLSGEENKLSYTLVTDKLLAADFNQISLEIIYRMPNMPQMGSFKSTIASVKPGQFDASYDISMGGLWEIKISVLKENKPIDEVLFSYNVAQ